MIIVIGAAVLSLIPSISLYFWMKNKVRKPEDEAFKQTCRTALMNGFLSTVFIVLVSGIFAVTAGLLSIKEGASIPATAYHNFIKLALSEELGLFHFSYGIFVFGPFAGLLINSNGFHTFYGIKGS